MVTRSPDEIEQDIKKLEASIIRRFLKRTLLRDMMTKRDITRHLNLIAELVSVLIVTEVSDRCLTINKEIADRMQDYWKCQQAGME